jgi:uncharacterized protein (TIGR00255 family)
MRSMTGYGKGECLLYDRKFSVEIKSVNHRYNDITIKQPRALNAFEDKIRKLVSREVSRGKTDIYITMETASKDDISVRLNKAVADSYMEQLTLMINR